MIDPTSVVCRFKWPSVSAFRLLFLAEETDVTLKINTLFIAVREDAFLSLLLHIQKYGITVI
jgi:hypothetical protein